MSDKKPTPLAKPADFTKLQVKNTPVPLKRDFKEACRKNDTNITRAIHTFMRGYVKETKDRNRG